MFVDQRHVAFKLITRWDFLSHLSFGFISCLASTLRCLHQRNGQGLPVYLDD